MDAQVEIQPENLPQNNQPIDKNQHLNAEIPDNSSSSPDSASNQQKLEAACCRICHGGLEEGKLFHPCKCSGSVKYVHEKCLKHWIRVSGKTSCELCGFKYKFMEVDVHSTQDVTCLSVVKRVLTDMYNLVATINRIFLVFNLWVIILPIGLMKYTKLSAAAQIVNLADLKPQSIIKHLMRFSLVDTAMELCAGYGLILGFAVISVFLLIVYQICAECASTLQFREIENWWKKFNGEIFITATSSSISDPQNNNNQNPRGRRRTNVGQLELTEEQIAAIIPQLERLQQMQHANPRDNNAPQQPQINIEIDSSEDEMDFSDDESDPDPQIAQERAQEEEAIRLSLLEEEERQRRQNSTENNPNSAQNVSSSQNNQQSQNLPQENEDEDEIPQIDMVEPTVDNGDDSDNFSILAFLGIGGKSSIVDVFWSFILAVAACLVVVSFTISIPFQLGRAVFFSGISMDQMIFAEVVLATLCGHIFFIFGILLLSGIGFIHFYVTKKKMRFFVMAYYIRLHFVLRVVRLCCIFSLVFFFQLICNGIILAKFISHFSSSSMEISINNMIPFFCLGFLFMMTSGQFIQFSRQLFRKKLIWFLVDPEEPSFSYVKTCIENSVFSHISKFGRTMLFCTSVQFFFFFLPLKFAQVYNLMPEGFFPLSFFDRHMNGLRRTKNSFSDTSNANSASTFPIFDIVFLFVLRSSIISLVGFIDFHKYLKKWFLFVGDKFDLLDYLFGEKLPAEELLRQQEKKEAARLEKLKKQGNNNLEENGQLEKKKTRSQKRRRNMENKKKMEEYGGYEPYIPKHHVAKILVVFCMFWSLYLVFINVILSIPFMIGKYFSRSSDSIICLQSGVYAILMAKRIISFFNFISFSGITSFLSNLSGNRENENQSTVSMIADAVLELSSNIWNLIIGSDENPRNNNGFLSGLFGNNGFLLRYSRLLRDLIIRLVKVGIISAFSFFNSFFLGSYLNGLSSIALLQATPSFMLENIVSTFLFGTFATFMNCLGLCMISSRFSTNFGRLLTAGASELTIFEIFDGFLLPYLLYEGLAYILPYVGVYYVLPRAIYNIFANSDSISPRLSQLRTNPYVQLFFHFVSINIGGDISNFENVNDRMYNPLYIFIGVLICVKFCELFLIISKKILRMRVTRIERLENFGN